MLRSVKDLESYRVSAEDGEVGTVADFYFDDHFWTIRYLVTKTGPMFDKREVLISPIAFRQADWESREFHLALTRDKVRRSPEMDLHMPVSRQHERDYYQFYGWPYYWGYGAAWSWGVGPMPGQLAMASPGQANGVAPAEQVESGDPHLRSARTVTGYYVQGVDGEIGHVADFIVDDESWDIRYLVVDTSNWWMGKKVLLSPHWAERVSWADNKVYVGLPRETIRQCPEWNPEAPVNRDYEVRLYDYYGRPTYWQAPAGPLSAGVDRMSRDAMGLHPAI